jgi:Tfp pilus assembly protein PilP
MLLAILLSTVVTTGGLPAADVPTYDAPTYNAQGRRDPFVNPSTVVDRDRPHGLPGFKTSEVFARGVVKNRGERVALLRATDGQTYVAHKGQRLYDGTIVEIAADAVIVEQSGGARVRVELPR